MVIVLGLRRTFSGKRLEEGCRSTIFGLAIYTVRSDSLTSSLSESMGFSLVRLGGWVHLFIGLFQDTTAGLYM